MHVVVLKQSVRGVKLHLRKYVCLCHGRTNAKGSENLFRRIEPEQ